MENLLKLDNDVIVELVINYYSKNFYHVWDIIVWVFGVYQNITHT